MDVCSPAGSTTGLRGELYFRAIMATRVLVASYGNDTGVLRSYAVVAAVLTFLRNSGNTCFAKSSWVLIDFQGSMPP